MGMGMDIQFLLFEVRILFGLQFCSLKGLFCDRKLLAHRMIRPDKPPKSAKRIRAWTMLKARAWWLIDKTKHVHCDSFQPLAPVSPMLSFFFANSVMLNMLWDTPLEAMHSIKTLGIFICTVFFSDTRCSLRVVFSCFLVLQAFIIILLPTHNTFL